jgi:hypothetical protein
VVSDEFTASVFFGAAAQSQGPGKEGSDMKVSALAFAGAGAVAGLLLIVAGVVFIMK